MPKISVIVPVYNAEKYLHRCVDSILAQTFTDFELLLINDGSKDSSGVICDEYAAKDSRVLVFHKENGGVSSARNMGLDNAKGEWISFVDSDDWVEVSMLGEVYANAQANNSDMVFTDIKYCYPDHTSVYEAFRWQGEPRVCLVEYLKKSRCVPAWALIRNSLIQDNKFRFPENITIYEDFHLLVRLIYVSRIITQAKKTLYNYRMQDYSIVHTTGAKRILKDQIWAYNSILNWFKECGVYEKYAPSLYGRILYDCQRFVLDSSLHSEFIKIYPEKKRFIWRCTTINLKLKIVMWCLTHHLSFIASLFCWLRCLIKSNNNEK